MESFTPPVAAAVTVGLPVHRVRHVERGSSPRLMTARDLTFPPAVTPTVGFRDTPTRSLPLMPSSCRCGARSEATKARFDEPHVRASRLSPKPWSPPVESPYIGEGTRHA